MPKELNLRPYQLLMRDHILDNARCAIWASMGTGKTSATLSALDILSLYDDSPVLIVGPKRVIEQSWPAEIAKWSNFEHLTISVITGNPKQRIAAVNAPAKLYATNPENLPWLTEHWGERWPYKTVVVDEATSLKSLRLSFRTSAKGKEFLAGQGGSRAKALGLVAHSYVKRFVELTGTPSPNGLLDLWGQIWFLDAGKSLGRTFDSYRQRYFKSSYNGYAYTALPSAQAEIQNALKDKCLTINGADWFPLLDPVVNHVYIDLPPKVRKIYDSMERQMYADLETDSVEAFGAAAKTIKCQQIANGFLYTGESNVEYEDLHKAKLEALASVVEEAAGMPVLVSYVFKADLARLQKAFPSGKVLGPDSVKTIADWNAGKIPILFINPASAAHGISLQDGGNIICIYSASWSLEHILQVVERIGPVRQLQSGYDRPVYVHKLIARDTIDEDILERLEGKRSVQEILLDALNKFKRKNK